MKEVRTGMGTKRRAVDAVVVVGIAAVLCAVGAGLGMAERATRDAREARGVRVEAAP
jgi:hypothetical protein